MPPEGVVDARGGLLRMTGHGFDKDLQGALQEHVHAAVVVVVVAAGRERKKSETAGRVLVRSSR